MVSLFLLAHRPSALAHSVLAYEPEWAALAEELGGTMVTVQSDSTGLQDPHRIEAKPSLIARTRNADLLICTGMRVEIGRLPILLRDSGNAKVQPGQPGYIEAGDYVEKLEIPKRLDRAECDVHAAGNHHIHGDPRNILLVADVLAKRLAQMDAAHAAYFHARYRDFAERWRQALRRCAFPESRHSSAWSLDHFGGAQRDRVRNLDAERPADKSPFARLRPPVIASAGSMQRRQCSFRPSEGNRESPAPCICTFRRCSAESDILESPFQCRSLQ